MFNIKNVIQEISRILFHVIFTKSKIIVLYDTLITSLENWQVFNGFTECYKWK